MFKTIDDIMYIADGINPFRQGLIYGTGGLGYKPTPYNMIGGTIKDGRYIGLSEDELNDLSEDKLRDTLRQNYDFFKLAEGDEPNDTIMDIEKETKYIEDRLNELEKERLIEEQKSINRINDNARLKEEEENKRRAKEEDVKKKADEDEERKNIIEDKINEIEKEREKTKIIIGKYDELISDNEKSIGLKKNTINSYKRTGQYYNIKSIQDEIKKIEDIISKAKNNKKPFENKLNDFNDEIKTLKIELSSFEKINEDEGIKSLDGTNDDEILTFLNETYDDSNNNYIKEASRLRQKYGILEGGKKMEKYTINNPSILGDDYESQNYTLTDDNPNTNAEYYIFDIKGNDKDWEIKTKLGTSFEKQKDEFTKYYNKIKEDAELFGDDIDFKNLYKNNKFGIPLTENKIIGGGGDFTPYYTGKVGDLKLYKVEDATGKINTGENLNKSVSVLFYLKDGIYEYDWTKDKDIIIVPPPLGTGLPRGVFKIRLPYERKEFETDDGRKNYEYIIPPNKLKQIKKY